MKKMKREAKRRMMSNAPMTPPGRGVSKYERRG
jgi:hypothetical protein